LLSFAIRGLFNTISSVVLKGRYEEESFSTSPSIKIFLSGSKIFNAMDERLASKIHFSKCCA